MKLMAEYYKLGHTTFTTPEVLAEIKEEQQMVEVNTYIASGQLIIDGSADFDAVSIIMKGSPGLSWADCSVVELASKKQCTILSTDGGLRKEATKRNLEVKGVLWIIECLHDKQVITTSQALQILELYPKINSRLPIKDIEHLRKKISNQQ